MCNCVHELLNVFEDSAQREHTICKHSRSDIVSVYRSPSTDVKVCLTELSNVFEQLLSLTKYVVVVGDLNIDLHKNTGI